MIKLMYITNNPEVAKIAQAAGVDRIFIDLEKNGKMERQGHIDSVKSQHFIEDVKLMRPHIVQAELLVRVNPLYQGSKNEVDTVIDSGADIVMLPMYKTVEEVKRFIDFVDGRAKVMLLLETKEAQVILDDVLKLPGIDEIHIGLNDLHLSLKRNFMFELLSDGTVADICQKIKGNHIKYGFGGMAAMGSGMLPAEEILCEHYHLGSNMVILSRSFCNTTLTVDLQEIKVVFEHGVEQIRAYEQKLLTYKEEDFQKNYYSLVNHIQKITNIGNNY